MNTTTDIKANLAADDVIMKVTPPAAYLGAAESFLPGIRALAQGGAACSVSLAMLSAFALEGLLRAYLDKQGQGARIKKDPKLRHNLNALWEMAQKSGLPLSNTPPDWVERLSQLHDGPNFFLRYATGVNGVITPAAQPMVTDLEGISKIVRKEIIGA